MGAYTTWWEEGIFVVALQKDPAGLDPDSVWEASSALKKFDDMYELSLVFKDGKTKNTRQETFRRSVADFLDENGLLCMDLLEAVVLRLHRSLSSDKKDN